MKKITWLLLLLLLTGCQAKEPINSSIVKESYQLVSTDAYQVKVPDDWQWEIANLGEGFPVTAVTFFQDDAILAKMDLVEAPNGELKNLPDVISVYHEEVIDTFITGVVEVIGDSAGGNTKSESHILIPLAKDNPHEFIDLCFEDTRYSQKEQLLIAESVVLRQEQRFGYLQGAGDEQLFFDEAELLSDDETERIQQLGIDKTDFQQGFFVYNEREEKELISCAADAAYYLLDENHEFKKAEPERFLNYLAENPQKLYFITLRDGLITTVEEFSF